MANSTKSTKMNHHLPTTAAKTHPFSSNIPQTNSKLTFCQVGCAIRQDGFVSVSDQFYELCFSCYYIRQLGCTMKPKKKSTLTNKKCTKKPTNHKPLHFIDKTIVTTKEKTHNTIQDPVQIKEHRTLVHTPRNMISRGSGMEKLEDFDFSPFSSPGASSLSPKCRKAISPVVVRQEKEKRAPKQKLLMRPEKVSKTSQQKRYPKSKSKTAKEQCNLTYQNFVLKKLDEKKITELSEESQASISKVNKLYLAAKAKNIKDTSKEAKIKVLKQKIFDKYSKELPSLKTFELKFYCSIVLIQRLWKEKRIQNIISEYISPRSNPDCNITTEIQRENNVSKLETTGTSQEQTSQLIRKYHNNSSIFEKKCQLNEREVHSTEMETAQKARNFQLKDLQLSAELAPEKQKKIIKFVECLRDIKFTKPATQSKKHSKTNVFNLQESLSQKCLMQSFYQKIFKNSPKKLNNFEVFNSKKEQKKLERSIELINNIKSPEKVELIEIEERFETQLQSQEPIPEGKIESFQVKEAVQKVQTGVGTNPTQQIQKNNQIKSLKQLNILSQEIMFHVLNEFCEEFHAFTSRSILRKKKKNSLPGLRVTLGSIEQYLTGLTQYMMQNYQSQVVRRFNLISPLSFLKIHHQYDDEQQQYFEEEDDQMNMPIIPNSLFYEYQLVYEAEKFKIREEDKKFSNFLQSLIKIHNLLLSNCLSQMLQKTRIQRVVLPWDRKFDANRHKKNKIQKQTFLSELNKIINSICSNAFTRVGQFHKRLDDVVEQQKLLKSISAQYRSEGNEWSAQYEYLELRMDLTKHVEQAILQEVMQDLMIFF